MMYLTKACGKIPWEISMGPYGDGYCDADDIIEEEGFSCVEVPKKEFLKPVTDQLDVKALNEVPFFTSTFKTENNTCVPEAEQAIIGHGIYKTSKNYNDLRNLVEY